MKQIVADTAVSTAVTIPFYTAISSIFGEINPVMSVLFFVVAINFVLEIIATKRDYLENSRKILGAKLGTLMLVVLANMIDISHIVSVTADLKSLVATYLLVVEIKSSLTTLASLGVNIPPFLLKIINAKQDEIDKNNESILNLDKQDDVIEASPEVSLESNKDLEVKEILDDTSNKE